MKIGEVFQPVIDVYAGLYKTVPQFHINNREDKIVTLIDNGHGGIVNDEYTTAPKKMYDHGDFVFYEGVWTRAMAYLFADHLHKANRNYILITPTDNDTPIRRRCKSINALGEDIEAEGKYPYVVSIHGNAFSDNKVCGIEVFTSPGEDLSDPVAAIYYSYLANMGWKMRPGFGKGTDKEARFGILLGHKYPAILPELGFYTNKEEATKMCNPSVMKAMAFQMFLADQQVDKINLFNHQS